MTYTTIQGDTWDEIAHNILGGAVHMDRLMAANPRHLTTYKFPAGVVLNIPEIDTVATVPSNLLPPWKLVAADE